MITIKEVKSREIFDSSARPAIETVVVLSDGSFGQACVSTNTYDSKYAAKNITDKDQNRFQGQGMLKAINAVEMIISPKIKDFDALKQRELDALLFELDGTQDKSRFGANTLLSISMAVAKAAAKSQKMPLYKYLRQFTKEGNNEQRLPLFIFTLINGGYRAENLLDFKDFFIIPSSFKSVSDSFHMGYILLSKLYATLKHKKLFPLYSIDGGYILPFKDNLTVIELFEEAFSAMNMKIGYDFFFGIDANADNLFNGERYRLKDTSMPYLTPDDLIKFYLDLIRDHHMIYLEDPLAQDDWEGWGKLSSKVSSETLIVGDFLTATNPARLQLALSKKTISGISIRPIQIGTVTESLVVIDIARMSGTKIIASNQFGSAVDDFIADFAVAVNADYVNFGPLNRGENIVRYNRLLEIEKELKQK